LSRNRPVAASTCEYASAVTQAVSTRVLPLTGAVLGSVHEAAVHSRSAAIGFKRSIDGRAASRPWPQNSDP
jgi:hypothetical protein